MRFRNILRPVLNPVVRSPAELRRYLACANAAAVGAALLVDVAQQLIFFTDWETAIRSWVVTIMVAVVIALPLLGSLGYAHLNLWRTKMQLELLSRTDDLTSLPNRRALLLAFDRAWAEDPILVLIDVDHFKRVNDLHGHGVGDVVLQLLAGVLAEELGGFGVVGRLGGEEFALVAPGGAPEALLGQLEHLRQRLSDTPFEIDGMMVPITVSAGAASTDGRDFDAVYHDADRALYAAKRAGRNQLHLSGSLAAWRG
jgi:diguanylate cyclase (GGDEF)-like protein